MTTNTPNLNIPKPSGTDYFNRTNFNNILDVIDQNAAKASDLSSHVSETKTGAHKAKNIALEDAAGHFTANELEGAMSELFQSVSDGKTLVKNAITGKGGTVLDSDGDGISTHQELADGVNTIKTTINGTATDGDVLSGKTYYNTDAKVQRTGTMPNKGAMSFTPNASVQTIPAGYHNGSGTVAAGYAINSNILMENMTKIKDNGLNSAYADVSANNIHSVFTYNGYIYTFADYYYLKKYTSSGTLVWSKQITQSTSDTYWQYDAKTWYIENGILYFLVGCNFADSVTVKSFNLTTEVITKLNTNTNGDGVDLGTQIAPWHGNLIGFRLNGNAIYGAYQYNSSGYYTLYFTKNDITTNTGNSEYNIGGSYSSPYLVPEDTKKFRSRFYKLGTKYFVYMYQGSTPHVWEINVSTGTYTAIAQESSVVQVADVLPDNSGIIGYNPTTNVMTLFDTSYVAGATFNAPSTFKNCRGHYPLLNDFTFYDDSTSGTYRVYVVTNRSNPAMFSLVTPALNSECTVPTSDGKIHRVETYDSSAGLIKGYTMDKETYKILA